MEGAKTTRTDVMAQASKELEHGGRETMEKFVGGLSPAAVKALHQYMKEHANEMVNVFSPLVMCDTCHRERGIYEDTSP